MKNVFNKSDVMEIIERINKLNQSTKAQWGKMSVDQMLAHCNVTYEMAFTNKHPKPNGFKKWILKAFVKGIVVSKKPYKKNGRTAPEFLIADPKNFEEEKARLIEHLRKTLDLGAKHFDGRESHSFGELSKEEWNNMFSKHLNYHLNQFGV